MVKKKLYLAFGIAIPILLLISYFIKINTEQSSNYIIKISLLGILILHNPFILTFYILIAIILIVKGAR